MPIAERLKIDLSKLKTYLKIEHSEDDSLLTDLIAIAKEQVDMFLQNDFMSLDDTGGLVEQPIPFSLKLAVYQLVGQWYENRTTGIKSKSVGGINYDIGELSHETMLLLYPHRRLVGL